jgi:hypothetical protein
MDAYMNQHKLDAALFPRHTAGAGSDGKDTPHYPLGA